MLNLKLQQLDFNYINEIGNNVIEDLSYIPTILDGVYCFKVREMCIKQFLCLEKEYKFEYNSYKHLLEAEKQFYKDNLDRIDYCYGDVTLAKKLLESSPKDRQTLAVKTYKKFAETNSNKACQFMWALRNYLPKDNNYYLHNEIIGDVIEMELVFRKEMNELARLASLSDTIDPKTAYLHEIEKCGSNVEFFNKIQNLLNKAGIWDLLEVKIESKGTTFKEELIYACRNKYEFAKVVAMVFGTLSLGDYKTENRMLTHKFIFETLANFVKETEPFEAGIPNLYLNRILSAVENAVEDPEDKLGLNPQNRNAKANKQALTQKSVFFVSWLYSLIRMRERLGKHILCADFAESYLSLILGDCSKNKTKIGWQSIKKFLIENNIIAIADSRFIHDSNMNNPMCIGYTLAGFEGLYERPNAIIVDGEFTTNCDKFTFDDLRIVKFEIDNKVLLKAASKRKVRYINPATVIGMQTLCLSKLTMTDEDYEEVTTHLIPSLRLKNDFKDEENYRATNRFVEAIHSKDYNKLHISQSLLTNRIFTGMTCVHHDVRKYFKLEGYEGELIQFDAKSSQLTLIALEFANKGNLEPLNYLVKHDIYQEFADIANKGIIDGIKHNFTRLDMKKECFHALFVNVYGGKDLIFNKILQFVMPRFAEYIESQKTFGNINMLAQKLQQTESSIFVGQYNEHWRTGESILSRLYQLGLWAITIHDSVIVRDCDKEITFKIIKEVYRNTFSNVNLTDTQFDALIKCVSLDK